MPFLFGLNTSTIRPMGLLEKIRIASEVGYDAIELWVADVEEYLAHGGRIDDLRKALDDAGLKRPSMISLKDWCQEDRDQRDAAFEAARVRLEIAAALGVERIVAGPPRGHAPLPLLADCYGELLELSVERGVPASLEFLGFCDSVSTLETAWMICVLCGHPAATVTVDPWHMFRGGSEDAVLSMLPASRISIVHWNDAPPSPPAEEQTDSHRVMPGDGILDLTGLTNRLRQLNYQGTLSLELFHEGYWQQDPRTVAREGLEKMRASVG